MNFKKKSQGLPLNTIIIAAIVLIVLIVLWAIFTGRMGEFTGGINIQDLETQASADNVGKTECDRQCFKTVAKDTQGKYKIFNVVGYKQTQCTTYQKPVGTHFSDLDETNKVCCILKNPESDQC